MQGFFGALFGVGRCVCLRDAAPYVVEYGDTQLWPGTGDLLDGKGDSRFVVRRSDNAEAYARCFRLVCTNVPLSLVTAASAAALWMEMQRHLTNSRSLVMVVKLCPFHLPSSAQYVCRVFLMRA